MLRDWIVCGVNNNKIQQRLLSEKTLTLTKALELAQGLETAAKNGKVLSQPGNGQETVVSTNSQTVHRVTPSASNRKSTSGTRPKFTGTCFCCGKVGYRSATCHFKDAVCHG